MQESLFSNSPYVLTLSIIALVLACYFPLMLGQKMTIKDIPRPILQQVLICIQWNATSIIGCIFFSGPANDYANFVTRQIIFCVQALAWVQLGNAIHHTAEINLHTRRRDAWKILNILGALSILFSTIIFIGKPELIQGLSVLGYTPFAERPLFCVYSLIFAIFVAPNLVVTCYMLFRSGLQTSDAELSQISFYMLGTYIFFLLLATLFDFVIPIAINFSINDGYFHFLKWFQFGTLFLAILCGQYFTSVSFKNKSAYWFLTKLYKKTGDGIIYFNEKGLVEYANPSAISLLRTTKEDLHAKKVSSIFTNEIDLFREATYNNIRVRIKGEDYTFKVSVFQFRQSMTTFINVLFFSDVTNSMIYQQRVNALNEQYVEYKQDLLRYQDRLDISQRKVQENRDFLATLINTLPFRFWSKNEQGVYITQNQKDINERGNRNQTTDPAELVSDLELKARYEGERHIFTTFELLDNTEVSQEDYNNAARDGQYKNIKVFQNMFIPIMSPQKPYKIIGIKIDITQQKHLEKERDMLQEQKHIHSRLEELGTICGAFAHDYNNILGSQIGFCQLAMETLANDVPAYSFISEALKAAQRGKTSLEELLNTIRGKTDQPTQLVEFAPFMIVEDVVKKVALTRPPNVNIVTDYLDKEVRIKGNVASLDRIISNMANNAMFAMKETGGSLTFKLIKEVLAEQLVTPYAPPIPAGEYAKISIADTGTGMDSGTLERIFSPFFTTKAPGEGLGLGLSSALRLLKEGHAYFTVQTTLGKGTIFNLYWPIDEQDNTEVKCLQS